MEGDATSAIVLDSSTGGLEIELGPQGAGDWCQVYLFTSGERRLLGAEGLQPLARRIAAFLADSSAGQRFVFTLWELHCSAYGEHRADRVVIAFQDADAMFFGELTLTPLDVQRWQLALAAIAARDHRAR